jgi:hypothetical protein
MYGMSMASAYLDRAPPDGPGIARQGRAQGDIHAYLPLYHPGSIRQPRPQRPSAHAVRTHIVKFDHVVTVVLMVFSAQHQVCYRVVLRLHQKS